MGKVYVIGGANIDIIGFASYELIEADSNIGKVKYSFGGVGRNIAENLARLITPVSLVTIFTTDLFGEMLVKDCHFLNIDTKYSKFVAETTSTYMALLNKEHDLKWALADMSILEYFNTEMFQTVFSKMNNKDILVVDTNLPEDLLAYVLENSPVPVYLDPISTTKVLKVKDHLSQIYMMKPNLLEAEALSKIVVKSTQDYAQLLDCFLLKGVKEIIISLGENGVLVGTNSEKSWFKHKFLEMENATGAGDSFLAGYLALTLQNKSIDEKVSFAIGCAVKTVQSEATVSKELNEDSVMRILNELNIEKQLL